jgi:hypothetical protein
MRCPFRRKPIPQPQPQPCVDRNTAAILDAISQLTQKVSKIMSALETLNANEAKLETVVAAVATAVTSNAALLGTIHGELVAALANGNQDPAIQAIADKLEAQTTSLQAAADALTAAAAANPDPNAVPAAPVDGSQPS